MEPFRPLVDRAVAGFVDAQDSVPELTQSVRGELLGALTSTVFLAGENRSLFDALNRTAASLVRCIVEEETALDLPGGFTDAQR